MTYESEKPETTKLIEQGHGYVVVRHVTAEPVLSDTAEIPIDGGFKMREGYVKADIERVEGGVVGVYKVGGQKKTTSLDDLLLHPPARMRPLE